MQDKLHGLPGYRDARIFLINPQHLLEQLRGLVFIKVFPFEAVRFKDLLPREIFT